MTNVVVIGGAGFVGTYLSKYLDEEGILHECHDIVKPAKDMSYCKADIENLRPGVFGGVETLINLAAIHRDDVWPLHRYSDVNVQGARNLCDEARGAGVRRIIFTSSVAVFGFAPPDTDENGAPNYFNEYGKTKFEAEKIYKQWQAEDPVNRSLVIVRPTVIFGPGNRGNVYNLLNQIAKRRFIMFG